MIDLHSHILPNVDDGARSLADALEMARVALNDGITVMAATPHGRSVFRNPYSTALVHERAAELCAALAEHDMPLEIVPGTELFCDTDLPERLNAGELLTYGNSRAVLVEFTNNTPFPTVDQMVLALQQADYRVVIAHPERLHVVQKDPNLLIPLIERGALMQLTAGTLTGKQGPMMRRIAEMLLMHGLIQVISTDAHGPHIERMPYLADARDRAAELLDDAAAALALVRDTPAALLNDAPLSPPTPRTVQDRQRWR